VRQERENTESTESTWVRPGRVDEAMRSSATALDAKQQPSKLRQNRQREKKEAEADKINEHLR
jgi:hypothetical protein